MLKGIDPALNADILRALRAMGHGDDLIIADANFPSDSVARQTVIGKLLRLDAGAPEAVAAVLSVMVSCRLCPTRGAASTAAWRLIRPI